MEITYQRYSFIYYYQISQIQNIYVFHKSCHYMISTLFSSSMSSFKHILFKKWKSTVQGNNASRTLSNSPPCLHTAICMYGANEITTVSIDRYTDVIAPALHQFMQCLHCLSVDESEPSHSLGKRWDLCCRIFYFDTLIPNNVFFMPIISKRLQKYT